MFLLEYLLFKLLYMRFQLIFSVEIEAKLFVEEDIVVTLMLDLLNFRNNWERISLRVGRDSLNGRSTLMDGADFEGWFRRGFYFMWGAWTGFFEVFMPRSFVKCRLNSGGLSNGTQIFKA